MTLKSTSPAALRESIALLLTPRFGTFWTASLLSNIGTWAQLVAQPWLLLSLGASSIVVGLDSFAMSAPVWFLTLVGGILADRADRRRVITTFQSIQMFCPIIVVVLITAGILRPWMIVALSAVIGITDALSMPSFSSIIPSIVERGQIGAGLALNATQFNLSRIAGPALAGLLMASIGIIGCFVVSAASYVPFIGVALLILPRGKASNLAPKPADSRPFAGFTAIMHVRPLRTALSTTFCSGLLCAPLITFCPLLVKDIFHGTAVQFSTTVGAFGAGGVLGAAALLGVDAATDRQPLSSLFAAGFAVTLIGVGVLPWFWSLVAVLILAGFAMAVTNTAANTVVLTSAPSSLRGQAVSLYMLAVRGSVALGSLITGFSVHWLGIRPALLANGVLALAAQLMIARLGAAKRHSVVR